MMPYESVILHRLQELFKMSNPKFEESEPIDTETPYMVVHYDEDGRATFMDPQGTPNRRFNRLSF